MQTVAYDGAVDRSVEVGARFQPRVGEHGRGCGGPAEREAEHADAGEVETAGEGPAAIEQSELVEHEAGVGDANTQRAQVRSGPCVDERAPDESPVRELDQLALVRVVDRDDDEALA